MVVSMCVQCEPGRLSFVFCVFFLCGDFGFWRELAVREFNNLAYLLPELRSAIFPEGDLPGLDRLFYIYSSVGQNMSFARLHQGSYR